MRFAVTLLSKEGNAILPINYQYPLSSALYKVISKGDAEYANFLHQKGYGKGFKFFVFSQIQCPFKLEGDRLRLLRSELSFQISFHLPQAMESFIKGMFQSERIDIADKKSRASFTVKSIESLPNPLQQFKENELVNLQLIPTSPVIAGLKNEKGNYNFLSPEHEKFTECLIYNWRSKINACYDEATASSALLMVETVAMKQPFKSRLITIKSEATAETKLKGWLNFGLKVTAEKRFVELLLNAGLGIYNGQGFGCVDVVAQ